MQLFHYHWWTDQVEDMEDFYHQIGFETRVRVGRLNGEIQTFNPPLEWNDFRDQGITFRIIEMVKGQTNITFGHGKKDIFDHVGILVNEAEYKKIIDRAEEMKWKVNEGERRTFISTPWKIRIELQRREEVVSDKKHTIIDTMNIGLPFNENPKILAGLLDLKILQEDDSHVKMGNNKWMITFNNEHHTRLNSIYFSNDEFNAVDPMNTTLIGNM